MATYYPGGSEEISGVGLTVELCKCQKKKCIWFILIQMFQAKEKKREVPLIP